MKIDFVSDVVCPWCAIGLASLQTAIARTGIEVDVQVQPFELNPQMGSEGEPITEHLMKKYGRSAESFKEAGQMIAERGAALGFTFDMQKRTHIYNTFDAHRLLWWANTKGEGLELERALLEAYHGRGENIGDHAVLAATAASVGLEGANEVLASDLYAKEVRDREQFYTSRGVSGVPAVIIDDQYLISGGQPPEVFEQALREPHWPQTLT